MSVGGDLAAARRRAGLTVREVSRRTCIRPAIIDSIEREDYSACGGDFYTRGHIRAIASAVGADPGPLIAKYETAHPGQAGMTAGLRPGPGRMRRHRPSWPAARRLPLRLTIVVVTGALVLVGLVVAGVTGFGAAAAPGPARRGVDLFRGLQHRGHTADIPARAVWPADPGP